MSKRRIVGSRELKTRLGQYLGRVRRGETLLITDRDEPVAELRPLDASLPPQAARLRKLAADGIVTIPTQAGQGRFTPLRVRGRRGEQAVSADRDERG